MQKPASTAVTPCLLALLAACSSPPESAVPAAGASGAAGAVSQAGAAGSTGNGGASGNAGNGGASGSEGQGGSALAAGGAAGGGSGGSDVVAAEPCPATALFCDDFEDDASDQPPGAPWQNSTNAATVVVDEVRAFSGEKSVHVNVPPANQDGTGVYRRGYFALHQGSSPIFPGVAQEMFGRAMMWLDATPDGSVHWTIVQGEGRSADDTHNRLYRYGGQQQGGAGLMANYETTDISTDCWQHSQSTMPTGRWACIEWRFTVASNEMQMWLDGTDVADIHVTGSGQGCIGDALGGQWLAPPAFQSLYLGWERYQAAGNDRNLWVDDVVVSTERIGCPQ